ncbi:MAG: plastocyanin/azurin family copper-binding protein [Magnetospirillum sp.]|nr:plastocyanin/azurin family copper-binding protein [Magnetospirillum sp.]
MPKFHRILLGVLLVTTSVAHAATTLIDQRDRKFSQSSVDIKVGDSLDFKNTDDVTHNIMVVNDDGDVDDKGLQDPGKDVIITFDKPGHYEVRCNIHPRMKMEVNVTQ